MEIIRPDLTAMHDYRRLPKIEVAKLKMLWASDYWDGPLSGMLLYNGEKCWFETFADDPEGPTGRRWHFLFRLTPEQLKEEEMWHQLFREKVGIHMDYDEKGRRPLGALKPEELWKEFYEPYQQRKPLDLSQAEVIGWFES